MITFNFVCYRQYLPTAEVEAITQEISTLDGPYSHVRAQQDLARLLNKWNSFPKWKYWTHFNHPPSKDLSPSALAQFVAAAYYGFDDERQTSGEGEGHD